MALTAYDDDDTVHGLVAAGVAGYVLKDESLETVARAVRTVMQGDTWFSQRIVEKLAGQWPVMRTPSEKPTLTDQESQMLQLLAEGKTDKEIGQTLNFAERTVRGYLQKVYFKLDVNTRVEAVAWAVQLGLVQVKRPTPADNPPSPPGSS